MDIRIVAQPNCSAAAELHRELRQAMRMLGIAERLPIRLSSDPSVNSPRLFIDAARVRPCLPEHGQIGCAACLTTHSIPDREIVRWHLARALGRKTVLFVCSGNAVRSQMAEAIVNHFLGREWAAFSCGLFPLPFWNPVAVALEEIGIAPTGCKPKHIELFLGCRFDMILSLCSSADQFCTAFPGEGRRAHMPFDDPFTSPFFGIGDLNRTRKLRDEMRAALLPYLGGAA
ncbi:MAG: arsenate reductase ArsC [Sulfuritalea sp.]|nr:arsenate reductase ArsC [Sulfuritalea sp.]